MPEVPAQHRRRCLIGEIRSLVVRRATEIREVGANRPPLLRQRVHFTVGDDTLEAGSKEECPDTLGGAFGASSFVDLRLISYFSNLQGATPELTVVGRQEIGKLSVLEGDSVALFQAISECNEIFEVRQPKIGRGRTIGVGRMFEGLHEVLHHLQS